MNRLDLSFATPRHVLVLFRSAAILAIGTVIFGFVSLLVATDLAHVSRRLWEIGQTTTVLAILAVVVGVWLSQEATNRSLE